MTELGYDPDGRIRTADNDPVYQPEDSDGGRDWQSNLGFAVLFALFGAALSGIVWYVFWRW